MFDRSVCRRQDAPLPNPCAWQAPHAGIPDYRTLAQRRDSRCYVQTATCASCTVSVSDSIREPEGVTHEQVNEISPVGLAVAVVLSSLTLGSSSSLALSTSSAAHSKVVQPTDIKLVQEAHWRKRYHRGWCRHRCRFRGANRWRHRGSGHRWDRHHIG